MERHNVTHGMCTQRHFTITNCQVIIKNFNYQQNQLIIINITNIVNNTKLTRERQAELATPTPCRTI